MFYPDKIHAIKAGDRVLEIGPGGTPHPRADVFLEKQFADSDEESFQRGHASSLVTSKPIFYTEGDHFPFKDKEFDYVICSHVLEHVDGLEGFVMEMTRVAKRGYVEFPTAFYEYLYNFDVHVNLLAVVDGKVRRLRKSATPLADFKPVNDFFITALKRNYTDDVDSLKEYMFQGLEWQDTMEIVEAERLDEVIPDFIGLPSLGENRQTIIARMAERDRQLARCLKCPCCAAREGLRRAAKRVLSVLR